LQQNSKLNSGRIERQLKQTFNAFHSVARDGGLAQLTSPNVSVTKVLAAASTSRRHLKSSTVSSTNSSTSSNGSSVNNSISISILAQHAVAVHPFIFQPNFATSQLTAPFIAEAIQGVSNHILPSQVGHFSLVGQSAFGPMTRLRKRKMAESSSPDVDETALVHSGSVHHPSAIIPSVQSSHPFVESFDQVPTLKNFFLSSDPTRWKIKLERLSSLA